MTNSYTNNECLTWLNTALHKTNQSGDERNHLHHRRAAGGVSRQGRESGFSCPGEFWGPYPSGAPAIFADQVAKLGFGSVLFSCVGNDAFGEMNIARLEKDGVNVNGIAMLQKATTGSAFVSYRSRAARFYF